MRYLFDCLTKNTLTLAKLYKYTKEDDEFLLYDPESIPVENFDVALLSNVECKTIDDTQGFIETEISVKDFAEEDVKEIDGVLTYIKEITDTRKMKSTLDFEKALEWCDVYVCMEHIEEKLNAGLDKEKETEELQKLFDRINLVMEKEKPIYLGNFFNNQFKAIANEYEHCINSFITKTDLEEIRKYKSTFFADYGNDTTQITMVVGVSGSSGKMSNAFKVKESYEATGEKVAMIVTEEIYPFFDTEKHLIYPFLRNFSKLTLDEEVEYLQCLIEKVIEEQRPNRIIIISQGGFGFPMTIKNYTVDEDKSKGVMSNIFLSAVGCNTIAVCGSWKHLPKIERLIHFIHLQGTKIDGVFISPLNMTPSTIQNINGVKLRLNSVGEDSSIISNLMGFILEYPDVPLFCNYMDVQEKIEGYIQSDEFFSIYKSYYTNKIIEHLNETKDMFIQRTGLGLYKDAIKKELAKSSEIIDEKLKTEILEKAKIYGV